VSDTPSLLLLLVAPALAGGLVYFLRLWPRLPHLTAALAALGTAYSIHLAPAGLADELLGRPLVLDGPAKQVLLVALMAVALSNVASLARPAETLFASTSLALASLVGLALTTDNLTLAGLFLVIGGVVLTVSLESSRGVTAGHLQYLAAVALGGTLLAFAAGIMDADPYVPSASGAVALQLGIGLLLGLFPVGLWKATLGRDADSFSSALVGLVLAPAAVVLLWRFTWRYPWLSSGTLLSELLRVSALVTVGYFSLRAAITASPTVYVASATQSQFALVVLVLLPSLGSSALLPLTSEWLLARVVPVLLLAVSVPLLWTAPRPATKVLFVFSVLSLIGLPGTPLFSSYLAGLLALPQGALDVALLIFMAGTAVGALRLALMPPAVPPPVDRLDPGTLVALLLALITVIVGLNPAFLRGLLA